MFHLIPFAAGVVVGAAVIKLFKGDTTRKSLDKAGNSLRGATVSSLEAIEGASARARARLTRPREAEEQAAPEEGASAAEVSAEAKPPTAGKRKPPARRQPRKPPAVATDDMAEEPNP